MKKPIHGKSPLAVGNAEAITEKFMNVSKSTANIPSKTPQYATRLPTT